MTSPGRTSFSLTVIPRAAVSRIGARVVTTSGFADFVEALAVAWCAGRLEIVARVLPVANDRATDISPHISQIRRLRWPESGSALRRALRIVGIFFRMAWIVRCADALYIILPSYWGTMCAFWIRLFGRPAVLQISGDIRRSGPLTSRLAKNRRWVALICDWVVTWAARTARAVIVSDGALKERYRAATVLTYVPFFVVPRKEMFLRDDCCENTPIRLLYVGSLGRHKGTYTLLSAMPLLPRERFRLTLVGMDRTDGELRCEAERLGVAERVDFEGYLPHGLNFWRTLRSSDIFVLPSLAEGTPRVLLEAMSQSLPVITTPVGSISHFLENGKSALFVKPESPEELADAVMRIAGNPELRRKLIREGYAIATQASSDDWLATVVELLR